MSIWCEQLVTPLGVRRRVRIDAAADGLVSKITDGVDPGDDELILGTVLPGMANAHSHTFHRLLRGHTHSDGGDFWRWRDAMYAAAHRLDPDAYRIVARAVFAEMLASGWTAVAEFHYLHHAPDGTPYARMDMEMALVAAASDVGIRLVLLDTCYLRGGFDRDVQDEQRGFADASVNAWLERWQRLQAQLESMKLDRVTLGAAIHSVRAVSPEDIAVIAQTIPPMVPLHVHASEQPAENEGSLAAYGKTPTAVLAEAGVLRPGASLVHATHLVSSDIELIGASGACVVFCPTTEADLGDGIGPARELVHAGARLTLGSDQNAVIDPFLEMRGLEAGERLRSGQRGRFDPLELLAAATSYAALGLPDPLGSIGSPCDLVEIRTDTIRTIGSDLTQLTLTATASDVARVVVDGRLVIEDGRVIRSTAGDIAVTDLLRQAVAV